MIPKALLAGEEISTETQLMPRNTDTGFSDNAFIPGNRGLAQRQFVSCSAIALSPFSAIHNGRRNNHADDNDDHGQLRKGDRAILITAEIAEALAVTTYTNIINLAPFFPNSLGGDIF